MKCHGITKTGEKCSRIVTDGSKYCWQHKSSKKSPVKKSPVKKSPVKKSPVKKSPVKKSVDKSAAILKKIAQRRDLNTIKEGVLTVSAYSNFYPICYKVGEQLKGLDFDLMKEFGRMTGLKVIFNEKKKFDGIWLDPVKDKSDIAIGGIGMSKARTTKDTEWTIPYFYVTRTFIYNKNNPIKNLRGIKNRVRGTVGSTGYIDAKERLTKINKDHLLVSGKTDQQDIQDLLDGKIDGLFRGSFVGKSIVKSHPQLAMIKPWNIDKSLVASDGEVFAYPTNKDSGIAVILSMMLTKDIMNKHLNHLLVRYKLD
jgi:ABC-type amino acid transport substrate-binding protein